MRYTHNFTDLLRYTLGGCLTAAVLGGSSVASASVIQFLQLPGSLNTSAPSTVGDIINLPGYGQVQVTVSQLPGPYQPQTGSPALQNQSIAGNSWGNDANAIAINQTTPVSQGGWYQDYTITFNFLELLPPDIARLFFAVSGLASSYQAQVGVGTTASFTSDVNYLGEFTYAIAGANSAPTLFDSATDTLSSGYFNNTTTNWGNTGFALVQPTTAGTSYSINVHQVAGDGIGFNVGYAQAAAVPEPAPVALLGLGLLGLAWARRKVTGAESA